MNLKIFSIILCLVGILELYSELSKEILVIIFFAFFLQLTRRIPIFITKIIKILLVGVTTYFLWKKFHGLFVTEVGISLIVVMSTLKLSELDSLDDYFNMFLILLLLESCIFISIPSLIIFIFGVLKIAFYFYFLLKLQKYNLKILNMKRVFLLMLPAFIFAIILYFTFPRFTQGFIGLVNSSSFQQKTGNPELKFSDFTEINLSDKVVFKAFNFSSNLKDTNKLYWKVNHLWSFRKNQWRLGNNSLKQETILKENDSNKIKYSIKTEYVYLDYIPHLEGKTIIENENDEFIYYIDNIFRFKGGVKRGPKILSLSSAQSELVASSLENTLALKLDHDKKNYFRQKILKNIKGKVDRQTLISELVKFFLDKKYQYSLSPRKYKDVYDFIENGVDGHCSHFSFAFAFLLRTLDIPSRIVIGYYGGNFNRFDNSISIREKDSHAWVEYIDESNHWQRIDPTELVIPERITLGTDQFLSFLLKKSGGFISFFESIWPNKISDQFNDFFDYIESMTFNFIFNFDQVEQKRIFKNGVGVIFSISIILFLTLYYFFTKNFSIKSYDPAFLRYKKFLKKMEGLGHKKEKHETASEFRARIKVNNSELLQYIDDETNYYLASFYVKRHQLT